MQIGRDKTVTIQVDMKPNMENPKSSTQKLLELINELSNVERFKINIQKSVTFLYNNNEVSER